MMRLIVANEVIDCVIQHAADELPNECCGWLTGHIRDGIGYILESIPLVNEYQSPISYRTEAKSLLTAHHRLQDRQFDLIAVYHSHPNQSAIPSRRDREEWTYGDTACAIVGMIEGSPEVRAWQLSEEDQKELEINITDRQKIETFLS